MVWKREGNKNISFPQIVQRCSKSMGGVELTDMLLSSYRILCKKKRWQQKIFWYVIDLTKIIAWIPYCHHFRANAKPPKYQKSLLQFSLELSESLILSIKVNSSSSRGRPSKRRGLEVPTKDKKPNVRFDKEAHQPSPTTNKNLCRLCSMK